MPRLLTPLPSPSRRPHWEEWIRQRVPARLGDVGRHAQHTGAQPAWYDIAPALADEPPGDVAQLTPDVAAASQLLRSESAHAQDFNTFCMHAMASDPHALRMLLRASGHALDTPVSRIVADGWSNLAPAVQYNLAVEVLAPAWLARTAPDFSDPAIWSGGRPG